MKKRIFELQEKVKSGTATDAEKAELAELLKKIKGNFKGKRAGGSRGHNNPQWWLNYPELAAGAANIAFNVIPGTDVDIADITSSGRSPLSVGLIAKAKMAPTIGRSRNDTDAFNSQIRQLWLDMHRKYRGIGTYEKSDLGIVMIAVKEAFSVLAKFERIYGVINSYKIGNRTIPNGLKEALGISRDLENNLADFRYVLNLYIKKMSQLCLPKDFTILLSDITMLSNLYADSENVRASTFFYDTEVYGVYNATRFVSGGCVDFQTFMKSGATPGGRTAFVLLDVVNTLDAVVSALLTDDDVARMCSDLLAAYGDSNVMTLIALPEDYTCYPVHDEERKMQFHNLTRVGTVASIWDGTLETAPGVPITGTYADNLFNSGVHYCIYQLNNTIKSRLANISTYVGNITYGGDIIPVSNVNQQRYCAPAREMLIDFWKDKPEVGDIMVATRFTSISTYVQTDGNNNYWQELEAFGSQVCEDIVLYDFYSGTYSHYNLLGTCQDYAGLQIPAVLLAGHIDWCPLTMYDNGSIIIPVGDVDNYTKVTTDTLSRIHEVCILSGYKVPVTPQSK